jgi:hypothetical protein
MRSYMGRVYWSVPRSADIDYLGWRANFCLTVRRMSLHSGKRYPSGSPSASQPRNIR